MPTPFLALHIYRQRLVEPEKKLGEVKILIQPSPLQELFPSKNHQTPEES